MIKDKIATQNNSEKFLANFPNYTIQYFVDDRKEKKGNAKTSAQFDLEEANKMQKKGCGVFFSINGFREGKRKKENLTNINAVYVDIDIAKEENHLEKDELLGKKAIANNYIMKSPLEPHFITETKNGFHLIWLVGDIETESDFIFITKGLTKYFKADDGGLSVNKVLRLPGFRHLKNPEDPFKCILLKDNSDTIPKYCKDEIIKKFNLDNIKNMTNETMNTPSREIQQALQLPIKEAIERSASIVDIKIEFKNNSDGSQQIIENGEETSGFISSRGEFVHSSSENGRKGNQLTVAEYYLNKIGGNNYNRQEIANILMEESNSTDNDDIQREKLPICDYSQLLKMDLPKVEFLVDELVVKNSLNLIVGDPGSFKSWFYLYLIYCIVSNKLVLGKYKVSPVNVLIIDVDDSLSLTRKRMEHIKFSESSNKKVYTWTEQKFKIIDHKNKTILNALSEFVKEKNIGLIVLDTLRQIHDGDENDSKEMGEVMTTLKKFAEEHNCAFILVHHKRKSGGKYPGGNVQAASGSIAIMANIFLSLHLTKYDFEKVKITREKGKSTKNIEPFHVSFQEQKNQELLFELVDKPNAKISIGKIKEKIKELFDEVPEPEMTKNKFIEAFMEKSPEDLIISKKSINDAFNELTEEEYIILDGVKRPNNAKFYIKNEEC